MTLKAPQEFSSADKAENFCSKQISLKDRACPLVPLGSQCPIQGLPDRRGSGYVA